MKKCQQNLRTVTDLASKRLRNNLENPQQIEMEENAEHGEGKQRKRHQGRRRIRNTQTINQKNRTCCDKNLCFF